MSRPRRERAVGEPPPERLARSGLRRALDDAGETSGLEPGPFIEFFGRQLERWWADKQGKEGCQMSPQQEDKAMKPKTVEVYLRQDRSSVIVACGEQQTMSVPAEALGELIEGLIEAKDTIDETAAEAAKEET